MRRKNGGGGASTSSSSMQLDAVPSPTIHNFVAPDGEIVLTPSRHADSAVSYEEVASPESPQKHIAAASVSLYQSNPYRETAAETARIDDDRRRGTTLSRTAVMALQILGDTIFSLCLLIAIGARVDLVSLYYLLVFCYGVVYSLDSKPVILATLVVSLFACVGRLVFLVLDDSNSDTPEIVDLFGFKHMHTTTEYLAGFGIDCLVLLSCSVHYFYVLRRLAAHRQRHFSIFAMGETMPQLHGRSYRLEYQRRSKINGMEWLCAFMLFCTAVSAPAIATGIYYVLLLQRLIQYTFFAKKLQLDRFIRRGRAQSRSSSPQFFLGPLISKLVLGLSLLVIILWYGFQIDDVRTHTTFQDIAKYVGFADFRGDDVDWWYYVFAGCQVVLFFCCAKLYNLHLLWAAEADDEIVHLNSPMESDYTKGQAFVPADPEDSTFLLQQSNDQEDMVIGVDIRALLKKQPMSVRAFLGDGGALIGSAAAIVWCVSYPSYASTAMIAWAFLTLAWYGLSVPSFLSYILIVYGTTLAIVEYVCNLTVDIFSEDYTKYGLKQFDYPVLDLSVHNLCLIVIYLSIRTQLVYQDILQEYRKQKKMNELKASDVTAANTTDEESRNSLTEFRIHANMRNIGYLVLAVLLMIFFKYRRKFWRILLFYALAACLAVFVRNVDCEQDDNMDLIGLPCYNSTAYTWGSLWPTLFSAQLLIIFQLVFQLVVYVNNKDEMDTYVQQVEEFHQQPTFFVSRLAVEIDRCFRVGGALVCYIAFLVVAIQFESGSTNLSTTVVGGIHLILLCLLLGTHLNGFPIAPRTSLSLKILWSIALIVEGLILVCRYVYQFDELSSYMKDHVFTSNYLSAEDFGFENHSSSTGVSSVFFYLLPTAILMALCFWQLLSMTKPVEPFDFFAAGRSRAIDRLRFGLDTIQQVLISCSTTAVIIVSMWAALDEINFIGEMYILVLIVGRPLTSTWKSLWFPLFWISALAVVLKYLIQLSAFNVDEATIDGEAVLFSPGDDSDWIGLVRLSERFEPGAGHSHLWDLISRQLLVMLMCSFQRMAQYFDSVSSNRRREEYDDIVARFEQDFASYAANEYRERSSSCEADDDDEDMKDRSRAFPDDNEEQVPPESDEGTGSFRGDTAIATKGSGKTASKAHRNKFKTSGSSRHAESEPADYDFFSCLRNFCTSYASKASVNMAMLLLTISTFVHQDVISILYIVIVFRLMYAQPATIARRYWVYALMLSTVILVEYSLMVWLPPFTDIEMQDTYPWKIVPISHQQWYALNNQHKWALMADFVTLLNVYLLPFSNEIGEDESVITVRSDMSEIQDPQQSFRSEFNMKDSVELEESDYILLTRKYLWFYLEFSFLAYWLPILLLVIFITGSEIGGIISLIYLWASVMMLYRLDESRKPSNPWIHYLRKLVWVHLFAVVIVRSPYFKDDLRKCRLGNDDSSNSDDCLSIANILGVQSNSTPYGLIVIFALIAIQCEIMMTPTYREVLAFILREQERGPIRREEITRDYYKKRTARWLALKKDKSAAIQRLKLIVSKLVHKVEELMDIALGLHHNLPPMAPSKPVIVDRTQNSITIEWSPPSNTVHKIRYYRISRQRYPSLTLLGDFGDIVEMKGDTTTATIEGLRPGTSYQFKVCAISRMGEGPFSAASEPIATYPLNLDGTTTAGWMKYRRESVPPPRFAFLISWMQPKFLQRYVVMDHSHLIFYRNEEIALKHRSRKRRKKLKTSFAWKDVISLRLSDTKVQYDDISPMLYCYEITVRHQGDRGDVKYIFQAELSNEFNMFISALAFAVPRETIDDSIINYLVDKQLPNPLDVVEPTEDDENIENYDDNKSEWSSVTGGESSLGDPEDQEFDKDSTRGMFAWRIPFYRLLYRHQNAAFQRETLQYEEDDQYEPSIGELVQIATNVLRSASANVCYLLLIICFTAQADLLNMVYVFTAFGFLILESPRPPPTVWAFLLKYSYVVIGLRYVFQLSLFCQGFSNMGYYYPTFQSYCTSSSDTLENAQTIQPMVLLGLYKFDGSAVDSVTSVFDGLQWNMYVVLSILWHRRELIHQGLWVEASSDDVVPVDISSDSMRRVGSAISSRDSIDDTFIYGHIGKTDPIDTFPGIPQMSSWSDPQSSSRHSRSSQVAKSAFKSSTTSLHSVDQGNDLASEMLEELQAEQEREEQLKAEQAAAAAKPGSTLPSGAIHLSKVLESVDEEVENSEQVEIDEASDGNLHTQKKKSWLETKFPKMHEYYETVICDPPNQWDKDIHIAITGEKPGRDFYTSSLAIQIFSTVYAVILFDELGEPSSNSTTAADASSRISSSSMLSGYLVLLVLICLTYIIWDRVAYVCQSLTSKVIHQYSYIFILHLSVWYLIPNHTNIYFQQRPALVIYYLQHCIYLWLGALQIRYGYPAFHGSKYNYTKENIYTKVNETLFPLVSSAPFIFEMRALLDYVCTKTSLSWSHWVLLEDTATQLFLVKLEMRGRVKEAEVLQGQQRQPLMGKLTSAGVMLLFLLLCLVGPLALFSSANPSTTPNAVTRTDAVFGIQDTQGTVNQLYVNSDINSPTCSIDKNTDSATVQCIEFDTFSREIWVMSPPRRDQLVSQLQSTEKLNWILTLSFERPGPENNEDVSVTYLVNVNDTQRNALIPMIKQSTTSNATLPSITVDEMFPPIIQITATEGVLTRSTETVSVNVTLHALSGSSWWTVEPFFYKDATKHSYCPSNNPFCVVAVSDNIVDGLSALGIGSYGITAVYVFVVMTIGGAVKNFFRGKVYQIQYNELPDPDDVLELIEGIYIAREEKYVGHLKDEVRIFETLVRVLRSPETLLKVTGTNVIHIPTAKEKID